MTSVLVRETFAHIFCNMSLIGLYRFTTNWLTKTGSWVNG